MTGDFKKDPAQTALLVRDSHLILWHRTPAAAEILTNGFRDAPQRILDEDGDDLGISGVFVSNRPLDANEGAKGRALLRIELHMTEAQIDQYEIKDDEGTYREWCIPDVFLNARGKVTLWREFEDEG